MALRWPLLDYLDGARSVLISGAGGGYDVYSGLPLAAALEARGARVHLAGVTFAGFEPQHRPHFEEGGLLSVDADFPRLGGYAPERDLCASVSDAILGHYGDHHSTARTAGTRLYINPLMALAWAVELEPLVRRGMYAGAIRSTRTWGQVRTALQMTRRVIPRLREWQIIPH